MPGLQRPKGAAGGGRRRQRRRYCRRSATGRGRECRRPQTAYLAVGYFPELPSYPLHEGAARDDTNGCHLTGAFRLFGTVSQHSSALLVKVNERTGSLDVQPGSIVQLLVDSRTRITGFARNGLPYVTAADRVRSSGVTCQFQGASSPAIVARAITPND